MAPAYASRFLGTCDNQKNQQINPGSQPSGRINRVFRGIRDFFAGKKATEPRNGNKCLPELELGNMIRPRTRRETHFDSRDFEITGGERQNTASNVPSWMRGRHSHCLWLYDL